MNNKDFTISEIENLTLEEVKDIAIEWITIKEHNCYFVNLGKDFGFSILVFKEEKHIYYANDYELHHHYTVKKQGINGLKQFYIDSLNKKLFTDAELMEKIKTYDEYDKKNYFLRNYWIMRYDYISSFYIGKKEEEQIKRERKEFPYFNSISFCYMKDKEIIDSQNKIYQNLINEYKKLKENNDTFREMISRELSNHEACITGCYTDALNALGLIFEKLSEEKKVIVKEELKKQLDNYY